MIRCLTEHMRLKLRLECEGQPREGQGKAKGGEVRGEGKEL